MCSVPPRGLEIGAPVARRADDGVAALEQLEGERATEAAGDPGDEPDVLLRHACSWKAREEAVPDAGERT